MTPVMAIPTPELGEPRRYSSNASIIYRTALSTPVKTICLSMLQPDRDYPFLSPLSSGSHPTRLPARPMHLLSCSAADGGKPADRRMATQNTTTTNNNNNNNNISQHSPSRTRPEMQLVVPLFHSTCADSCAVHRNTDRLPSRPNRQQPRGSITSPAGRGRGKINPPCPVP